MSAPDRHIARVAIEALRAGVPNGAAIRMLGSTETALEQRFAAGLGAMWGGAQQAGLIFSGGFGTGKSHLLGHFREEALRRNYVVSRVTISKETPLSNPGQVFAAAMRGSTAPGRPDDMIAVALAEAQRRPGAVQELELWASTPDSGVAPVFSALSHILARNLPPELTQGIEAFLSGGKPPTAPVRKRLAELGARGMFDLAGVAAAALQWQRPRYMARLIQAAGFGGWCVLLDEVELIGRYGPVQRANAYAELARWLGLARTGRVPGLQVTAAITDDFADEVINHRQDDEKLPERLRLKGQAERAELAAAAMRAIRAAPTLRAPTEADLARDAETLRACYAAAYGWPAPEAAVAERRTNRTMRHHIRGWITQWDMLRLQGSASALEVSRIASDYSENEDFSTPPPEEPEPG